VVRAVLDSSVPLSSLSQAQLAVLDVHTLQMIQQALAARVAAAAGNQPSNATSAGAVADDSAMSDTTAASSSSSSVAASAAPWHPSLPQRFDAAVHAALLIQEPLQHTPHAAAALPSAATTSMQ
jgi:hypothetical protein